MKKLILSIGIAASFFSVALAKENVPDGIYTFSLTKEYGPVRKLKVSFHSENRDSVDTLVADIESTLDDGKVMNGQIACISKSNGSELACNREDDGGGFKFVRSKTISGNSLKYTLKITQFALSEEGDDELIEIKAKDGKPFELAGLKEEKK